MFNNILAKTKKEKQLASCLIICTVDSLTIFVPYVHSFLQYPVFNIN